VNRVLPALKAREIIRVRWKEQDFLSIIKPAATHNSSIAVKLDFGSRCRVTSGTFQ
jgi:hypothetical protein